MRKVFLFLVMFVCLSSFAYAETKESLEKQKQQAIGQYTAAVEQQEVASRARENALVKANILDLQIKEIERKEKVDKETKEKEFKK
jgi:sortase (surface protein transpeptidase)